MTNINPETGVRYGIISAQALDPEVVHNMQCEGRDVHYENAKSDLSDAVRAAARDYLSERAVDDLVDSACELMSDNFEDDEPVHEFFIDGVRGSTTWLGGALLVWVFESPVITKAKLCSPCVPNAGDLDNRNEDGWTCYDVPADWRKNKE